MQITYRIYSDELTPYAPEDADAYTWTRDVYAPALMEALEERFGRSDVEIDVQVIPHTSGYGAGPSISNPDYATEDHVRIVANRVLERLSQAPVFLTGLAALEWAEGHGKALWKHADPTEGGTLVSLDEAREVAREDPALLAICPEQPGLPPWGAAS